MNWMEDQNMTRFQHINVLGIRKIIVLNSCFIVCTRTFRCVNYKKHSEIYSKVLLKYIRFLTNILDKLGKNLLQSQGIRNIIKESYFLYLKMGKTTNSGLLVCYNYR
jgi:hypothetical protein